MNDFSVCAITTLRNDRIFLRKWVSHYGEAFGKENLFVIIDGQDQIIPDGLGAINILRLPHRPSSRSRGDRLRARFMSKLAAALLQNYNIAVATDVDEFIVVDPDTGLSLKDYLSTVPGPVISALGLDVAQHLDIEAPIDLDQRFLEQRSFAHVNSRYTKASIITKPLKWGSGMHRVKGRNFKIDPNLFLFHFGMVDHHHGLDTTSDQERVDNEWSGHSRRRLAVFDIIQNNQPTDDENAIKLARRKQTYRRPFYAWNKPGRMSEDVVIAIPKRFRSVV